jgi:hypothetical protein
MRARAEELNISRETIDLISGLTTGHAGKLLSPRQAKCLGMRCLGPALGALALKLAVLPDYEAYVKIQKRLVPRDADRARPGNKNWETHRMNAAKYRLVVRENETCVAYRGMPYKAGSIVSHRGWPELSRMEPVTEAAKTIASYY